MLVLCWFCAGAGVVVKRVGLLNVGAQSTQSRQLLSYL